MGSLEQWGSLPEPTESGTCLVVGGGHTVWEDLEKAPLYADVMCINDIAMHYPGRVKHMYSNHANHLYVWSQARSYRHCHRVDREPNEPRLHSCNEYGKVQVWPWPGHGTSSLNGVLTALGLGYEQVVCCGIPLDDGGYYFDPPERLRSRWRNQKWSNFTCEVPDRAGGPRYWRDKLGVFDGRVTALSGRLKPLLEGKG